MHTGHIAVTTGVYRSDCTCHFFARIARGEEAPRCPQCLRSVGWEFIRSDYVPVVSPTPSESEPQRPAV